MKKHDSSLGEAVLQLAAACGDLKRSLKATPGSDGTGGDAEGRKTRIAFPRSRHRWAPRENTSIKPTAPTSGEQTADGGPLRRAVGALPPGCSTEPCSAARLPKTSGQAIFNRLRPSSRGRGSEKPSSDLPPPVSIPASPLGAPLPPHDAGHSRTEPQQSFLPPRAPRGGRHLRRRERSGRALPGSNILWK